MADPDPRVSAKLKAREAVLQRDPSTGFRICDTRMGPRIWLREYCRAGGLNLDPKFWRVDHEADEALYQVLDDALSKGWGADKAWSHWLFYGEAYRYVCAPTRDWQSSGTDEYQAVIELFVKEINRAYRECSRVQGERLR